MIIVKEVIFVKKVIIVKKVTIVKKVIIVKEVIIVKKVISCDVSPVAMFLFGSGSIGTAVTLWEWEVSNLSATGL